MTAQTGGAGADALARVWRGHCGDWCAWGAQPEAAGAFEVERRPGVVCAWWRGRPDQMQDNLWVEDPAAADPERLLASVRRGRGGTDIRLPPQGDLRAWTTAALRHGYRLAGSDPLLACPLRADASERADATPPPPPPTGPVPRTGAPAPWPARVAVAAASGDADYEAALGVIETAFGGPRALTRFFAPRRGCRVYLARWDGRPAAAASVCPRDGAVSIYSVSTRPEFRRRGVAGALVSFLLDAEARQGADLADLRSADALVPYYGRRGFQVVGRTERYHRGQWG